MEDIQKVAKVIDLPIEQWAGNCYSVACAIVKAKIVRGKARYGIYGGYISKDSIFAGREIVHHGWVERHTTLVDPTRWVFECAEPYIYVGPKDNPDYDFGSNRLRKMMLKPPPKFDSKKNHWKVPKHLQPFVHLMLGEQSFGNVVCAWQMMWLASLPLDMLEDKAEALYRWIIDDVKVPSFIPVDNRDFVLGDLP